MKVVRTADMPSLPEGTIYSVVIGGAVGEFPGYTSGLYRVGPRTGDARSWTATELLPQPLAVCESDGRRRLRIRPPEELCTLRMGAPDERFYVYEAAELSILVRLLQAARDTHEGHRWSMVECEPACDPEPPKAPSETS